MYSYNPDVIFPLSFAQKRLWFLNRLEPDSPYYNIPANVRICGVLDMAALAWSVERIVERHEALRTVFRERDGEPEQQILERITITFPQVDAAGIPPAELDGWIREQAKKELRHPFDLSAGPLLRFRLFRIGDEDHVLLTTMHHIVSDAWSMGIFIREFTLLYGEKTSGIPCSLPDLPIQYADYAEWQHEWLAGEGMSRQLDYWKRQLADAPPLLELPLDRSRPNYRSFEGGSVAFEVDVDIVPRLKALCGATGTTLFMTLLGVLSVLLSKYGRQEDIVVGSPVANRNQSEIEGLIGFFVNTLVLRVDLSGNPSFRDVLERMKKTALDAYDHQDVPFEQVVDAAEPQRHLNISPLFQVSFAVQNAPVEEIALPGLSVHPLTDIETGMGRFDLEFAFWEEGGSLYGSIVYKKDIFDAQTVERMGRHFQTLLDGAVKHPETRIGALSLMEETERRQLLVEWNATATPLPETCVHQLFEAQAAATPEATAVVFEDETLSYVELNARANRLAHALIALGVEPDAPVAIALERSPQMIVALLAVLKAGGAYVPLDPDYPSERLAFMLEDSGARILLTQETLRGRLPQAEHTLCLDADESSLAYQPDGNPGCAVEPHHLAYIIYTSGSTGKPKGVAVSHRGVVRLVRNTNYVEISTQDVLLLFAPISFDASTFEIWGSLLNGARLAIYPPELPTLDTLCGVLRQHQVSILWLTAGLFHPMVDDYLPSIGSVKQLLAGGDVLSSQHVHKFLKEMPGCCLINGYGPTENTTFTCCYRMTSPNQVNDTVPIGRPISNTQIYVLDRHLQPAPLGVPGELHIGGAGLARGYLNRPELTAEKFIPDPFSATPGARLYKTGDLVRYRPDGNLEFLGRIDHQVKIRGFRIELGEIEAALTAHPAIREAVVIARSDETGDKRLVAYVVPDEGNAALAVADLRAHLKTSLPDYMIPSAFVLLDTLPLTSNGKVDRKALLQMELSLPLTAGALPSTLAEIALSNIWREVLGLAEVGVHNNFFELGGHSLLAMQVVSRTQQEFGVQLPLRKLFEKPTIYELAQAIEELQLQQANEMDSAELESLSTEKRELLLKKLREKNLHEMRQGVAGLSIPHVDRSVPIPLSFAQERLWFLDQLESQVSAAAYNIPVAYRLRGNLNVAALEAALNEIIRRHEVLRTNFSAQKGQPFQRIAESLFIPLAVADLPDVSGTDEKNREVNRIAVAYALEKFDLAAGPLIRWRLLRLPRGNAPADEEHILLATMHHIVSDGWSSAVIAAEVTALYEAFLRGQPSPLPALPVQYADFSAWQRSRFSDGVLLENQMAYWRKQLEGIPPVLDIPCRKARPQEQSYRGKIATFKIEACIRKELEKIGQNAGATSFMTLLSAFSLLLSRYGGGDDLVIGSPIANRGCRELEPLIGFFANTLALRIDLSGSPTFNTLLERVKARALEAYTHQDIPFEKLVKELAPQRSLSHAPLFQVMFVLQNAPQVQATETRELSIETVPVDIGVSHFDLVMYVLERDGGYFGMLEYAEDLFDQAVVENMLAHFQTLLAGIAENPRLDVSAYPLAADAEYERIMKAWSRLPRGYPFQVPVEALFEECVAATPDAPALAFAGKTLSYGELNARANRLARYLREKGVGQDSIVGLMMARTEALPVALLGILKAGGAYLPIDPEYPPERITAMLEDSGTLLLLTEQGLCRNISFTFLQGHQETQHTATQSMADKTSREILYLDLLQENIGARDASNLDPFEVGNNLAYVLYTSGSTGKPKGVGMTRYALSNLIRWHLDHPDFSIPARTLQFAPYTFDVSFQEVFSTWCSGGTLHIASNDLRRDAPALLDYVERERIERLFLPYVALQQLAAVAVEHARYPRSVRDVVTAGEQLRISPAIAGFFEGLGECRFHNHYGPSETHVVTAYTLEGDTAQWPALPSIGKPLANTEIYILDPSGRPVPAGVPGELFVGGIALARGYLGQEAMTAERFVANPFREGNGERMYMTGDLALWEPDGNIKFLGRADNQVKIRGFRIEPGETEAVLNKHPEVGESVVIDVEYGPGDRRLAAYVVPRDGRDIDCAALRDYVKGKLPEYMVPSAFVAMEKLPVTSSGKVNRRQLPHPGDDENREVLSSPSSPVEEVLAAIWAEVLKIDAIGVEDNFFELGGHSLLATQLISRIREAFSLDIPVRQIFDTPTVRGLARHIETCGSRGALKVPPIVRVARGGEYPLSFAQERLWFLDRLQGRSANYNMSAAIGLSGEIDEEALRRSISEIVRRHEVLRTTFRESGGHPVAVIAPYEEFPLPVVDIGAYPPGERGAQVERLIAREAVHPFDLEKDTLLKGTLLRLPADDAGKGSHILVLAMHHIVADNWSSGVFINELTRLYEAFRRHGEFVSPLPELEVQYVDFACWQRQWLTGEPLEVRLDYWRKQLAGVSPVLQVSRRAAAQQGASPCKTEHIVLGLALSEKIRKLCLREGASLYMGLLAAYATLLFRYTGREDILVGSPIANRHYKEIEPLIGFFVNTLPLRVDLSGEPSYRELVKRVRKMALEAFTHQDVPFERIVREVCPDRGESRTPLVQVIFAMQNAPAADIPLEGGAMTLLPTPSGAAKFDLILSMSEAEGKLHGVFEYDAGLFDREEIATMAKHFVDILEHVVAHPDEKVVDISLAAGEEARMADETEEFSF